MVNGYFLYIPSVFVGLSATCGMSTAACGGPRRCSPQLGHLASEAGTEAWLKSGMEIERYSCSRNSADFARRMGCLKALI